MQNLALSKIGVRVINPELPITIDGASFANLILDQHLHSENLRLAVALLKALNPHDSSEELSALQGNLHGLSMAAAGVTGELLRVASAQGLIFELIESSPLH
ncbi:hypothetical protein [Sulfuriferula sp.]|uniref:hypothetical protein n=1 Tax=Sulfuriferula sp. TaxID=2025307 RepID=UPI0027307BAE|nr:hypothetical protein [Sulfuriferula sp.]MDP2025876.1 hypothetical protein [Sulfuriferula sp.]